MRLHHGKTCLTDPIGHGITAPSSPDRGEIVTAAPVLRRPGADPRLAPVGTPRRPETRVCGSRGPRLLVGLSGIRPSGAGSRGSCASVISGLAASGAGPGSTRTELGWLVRLVARRCRILPEDHSSGARPKRGVVQEASTSCSDPPMEVQSSSHMVETSHERSAGNIRSGSAQLNPFSRQPAAC